MSEPKNKLFRCEVWNEEGGDGQGGLFVDFYWAADLAELEKIFGASPGENLYRGEECSADVVAAWQSGYDEGIMVGIVGERIKDREGSSNEAVLFDIFEELLEEQGETNGQQQ